MRIISQDGVYDIPYQSVVLAIDGNSIVAGIIGEESTIQMAYYSDPDRARYEMERLHLNYRLKLPGTFQFAKEQVRIRPLDDPGK